MLSSCLLMPCARRWQEDFEMLVHDPEHQELTAVLYNHSTFGADEEIGRVTVPLSDLPAAEEQDLWLELGPPAGPKHGNPLGAGIRVSMSFTSSYISPRLTGCTDVSCF